MQFHISKTYVRWFILAILLIGVLYSFLVDTTQLEIAPKCMFYQLTGFKCPGCGTQRALHELVHLNFVGVIQYNPILLLGLPYLVLLAYLCYFNGDKHFPKLNAFINSRKAILFVFGLIVVYWIGRNIINI